MWVGTEKISLLLMITAGDDGTCCWTLKLFHYSPMIQSVPFQRRPGAKSSVCSVSSLMPWCQFLSDWQLKRVFQQYSLLSVGWRGPVGDDSFWELCHWGMYRAPQQVMEMPCPLWSFSSVAVQTLHVLHLTQRWKSVFVFSPPRCLTQASKQQRLS